MRILLATANLPEQELGKYCRMHGIYTHQLEQWREEVMKMDPKEKETKFRHEIKALKAKNKRLDKELRRKEKALVEASALLLLKKKAQALWGDSEDD